MWHPFDSRRCIAACQFCSVREAQASLTTKTSMPAALNCMAVCNRQMCASHPLSPAAFCRAARSAAQRQVALPILSARHQSTSSRTFRRLSPPGPDRQGRAFPDSARLQKRVPLMIWPRWRAAWRSLIPVLNPPAPVASGAENRQERGTIEMHLEGPMTCCQQYSRQSSLRQRHAVLINFSRASEPYPIK